MKNEKVQSIPNGTKAIFTLADLSSRDFTDGIDWEGGDPEDREGQICEVVCLATATELGEKDYEYYDIKFADGVKWGAISGYHLELGQL